MVQKFFEILVNVIIETEVRFLLPSARESGSTAR